MMLLTMARPRPVPVFFVEKYGSKSLCFASLGMPLFLRRAFPPADFVAEWKLNLPTIVVTGLLQFAAYALVLTALQVSRVSYVAPFREIGIVIGVLMGALLLNEPF